MAHLCRSLCSYTSAKSLSRSFSLDRLVTCQRMNLLQMWTWLADAAACGTLHEPKKPAATSCDRHLEGVGGRVDALLNLGHALDVLQKHHGNPDVLPA